MNWRWVAGAVFGLAVADILLGIAYAIQGGGFVPERFAAVARPGVVYLVLFLLGRRRSNQRDGVPPPGQGAAASLGKGVFEISLLAYPLMGVMVGGWMLFPLLALYAPSRRRGLHMEDYERPVPPDLVPDIIGIAAAVLGGALGLPTFLPYLWPMVVYQVIYIILWGDSSAAAEREQGLADAPEEPEELTFASWEDGAIGGDPPLPEQRPLSQGWGTEAVDPSALPEELRLSLLAGEDEE